MSATLEPLGRRPIESMLLRELRHVEALAAREVTPVLMAGRTLTGAGS